GICSADDDAACEARRPSRLQEQFPRPVGQDDVKQDTVRPWIEGGQSLGESFDGNDLKSHASQDPADRFPAAIAVLDENNAFLGESGQGGNTSRSKRHRRERGWLDSSSSPRCPEGTTRLFRMPFQEMQVAGYMRSSAGASVKSARRRRW